MKKGFSIIELAIVIVVIGVLISIFFFARGVVETAKVNALITEITYFKNAHDSFREKYGFRPGDVPDNILARQGFAGNSIDTCGLVAYGNNSWDSNVEYDLLWIQLSSQKFIRQLINFDPCPVIATSRDPGTHRPASDAVNGTGWTYVTRDTVTISATDYNFLYSLKIGQPSSGADAYLSKGKIKVGMHMDIDAKIDLPFTPTSGKYYVHAECVDTSTGAYKGKNDTSECVGGYAEVPSEDLVDTYTP